MELSNLLNFDIVQDSIDVYGERIYLFRVKAPNFQTLDAVEKEQHRHGWEDFLRGLGEHSIFITALDKVVNLDANRAFISGFDEQFSMVRQSLLRYLDSQDSEQSNTERAYYIGIADPSDGSHLDYMLNVANSSGLHLQRADNRELRTVLRSFLLREFIDPDIYLGGD